MPIVPALPGTFVFCLHQAVPRCQLLKQFFGARDLGSLQPWQEHAGVLSRGPGGLRASDRQLCLSVMAPLVRI